jgi:sortase B
MSLNQIFSKYNFVQSRRKQKNKLISKQKNKRSNTCLVIKQKNKQIKTCLALIWLSGTFVFSSNLANRYITYQEAEQEYQELDQIIWNNPLNNQLNNPLNNPLDNSLNNPLNKSLNKQFNNQLNNQFNNPLNSQLNDPLKNHPPLTPIIPLEKQLKEINPDYIFWLTIPGTTINYPVVRSRHPGYYLNHTFKKSKNPSGSLFIQEDALIPGNENTVIFGHNMKDGTMFSDLKKYKNEIFYKNHDIIQLYCNERWYQAKIFSIQIRHESDLNCYETEFNNPTQKQEFIYSMKETSLYPTAFLPSVEDPIISLSTCYGQTERMIVQASILCYTDN